MDILNQQISRSRGVTAFGQDGYQQISTQYKSSFSFISSLIPYENSINLPVKQAVDSCWTSGNIFRLDRNSGLVLKTNFHNEELANLSLSSPYSLSVIQSVVPMVSGGPPDEECIGCWIVAGTSVYRTDSNLNVEVEINNLSNPTLVCVNHSNNGCYVVNKGVGIFSFDFNGDLIGIGTFSNDPIIEFLSNSNGELFVLTEYELYKFINVSGNIGLVFTFNLPSYLTSTMLSGSFDIDTSTNYIYTASGDNTTTRIVKFNSSGSYLGQLSISGNFPYVLRVSQHPSSISFYVLSDSTKIEFVRSSSSSSSEMYSESSSSTSKSSNSSSSSFGFSESSSTSSFGFSESSSTSSFGFSESSSDSSFGFSESSSDSSFGYSESSSDSSFGYSESSSDSSFMFSESSSSSRLYSESSSSSQMYSESSDFDRTAFIDLFAMTVGEFLPHSSSSSSENFSQSSSSNLSESSSSDPEGIAFIDLFAMTVGELLPHSSSSSSENFSQSSSSNLSESSSSDPEGIAFIDLFAMIVGP